MARFLKHEPNTVCCKYPAFITERMRVHKRWLRDQAAISHSEYAWTCTVASRCVSNEKLRDDLVRAAEVLEKL